MISRYFFYITDSLAREFFLLLLYYFFYSFGWSLVGCCVKFGPKLHSLVVLHVPHDELELLVAQPEHDVPADEADATGAETFVEGGQTLRLAGVTGASQRTSVLPAWRVHEPAIQETFYL